jgi:RimJ/RimL family protein N-acetyltransferase
MDDLLTSRLVLHPLTAEEAARLVGGTPGPGDHWADGFPTEGDRDGARMYAKATAAGEAPPGPFVCYRIDSRRDGAAIGTIGFYGPPDEDGRVIVGYGLVPPSWGNGYATEALRVLVELCRAHGSVTAIDADTDHDNHASQRVLAKNGFHVVRQDRDLIYYELVFTAPAQA